jgi:hypothetical protein
MPEIKLDITTLPEHERKVKFLSVGKELTEEWLEGVYLADEQLFLIGFGGSGDFENAWQVDMWEYL